jgi:hypothetical protein
MGAGIARVAYWREIEVNPEQDQRKQHDNDENGGECRKLRVLHEPAISGCCTQRGAWCALPGVCGLSIMRGV